MMMKTLTEKAIAFNQVHYSDGPTKIINGVTGSFSKGRITSIVGPSGAGKTTLFRLCNGLISPIQGNIFINGKDIQTYEPTELRRNVGLALQSATMVSGTVYNNLSLPRKLNDEQLTKEEATDLLESVNLDKNLLKRNVMDLSGGQRQKVSIARTLVNRPKILLLDEITSSLDRISKQEIEELIIKINKEFNVTIIWITHNLEQATQIGDHTWVMINGELLESGNSSLLLEPQNKQVRRFVKGEFQ